MISNTCSLSHLSELLLSHLCAIDGWVCVTNRESHSLFILVSDLTITQPRTNSLGESNNPSAPQLWGLPPPWSTRKVNLNSIAGTISPTYNGGLTSMNLDDFIILMTLPIGTSVYNEIQMILLIRTSGYNISEYIPNLQIHQHSLLTRKLFSWHNSSTQVFFSGSSSKLDHHWIIIKARSSLDHRWIIIKTGSSSSSLLPLSQSNGAISQFYSSQEVLQSQPFSY